LTVPPELVGAWRRVGVTLGGRRLVDHCDVVWLQTPSWFADVRLRLAPGRAAPTADVPAWLYAEAAFGGVAAWSAPRMTWRHELDLDGSVPPGCNDLCFDAGVLVERGDTEVNGRPTPFREEWLRMSAADPTWSARRAGSALRVEVGRWAIELLDERPGGSFSAVRLESAGGEWREAGRLTG